MRVLSLPGLVRDPDWGPFAALIKREFLTQVRSLRSSIFLALCVAAGIIAVLMAWPEEERVITMGGALSQSLITSVAFLLFGACVLFVPAVAATSIVIEREQETLDQLQTTLIRPSSIVLGKLVNVVGFYLLLVIAMIPIVSTVLFMVGVDWYQLLGIMVVIFSTAICCAMAGIYASARCRKTISAIALSYAGMLLTVFGGQVLAAPLGVLIMAFGRAAGMNMFMGGTPMTPIAALTSSQSLDSGLTVVFYHVLLAGILFSRARRLLEHAPAPLKILAIKPIDDPVLLRQRRTTWPFYLIDPLARKKQIEDGRNPVLIRELRWGVMNRATMLVRIYLASFVVCFFSSWPTLTDLRFGNLSGWFVFQMVAITVLSPIFISNALTKEYELGNFDMLRMTLLTPMDIILGKWAGAVVVVAPFVMAGLTGWISFLVMRVGQWPLFFTGYTTLFLCAFLSISLGLFASVLSKRTTAALVLGCVFTALVFYGQFILRSIFGISGNGSSSLFGALRSVFGFSGNNRSTVSIFGLLDSPVMAFARNPNAQKMDLDWVINTVFYSILCLALIWYSARVFERRRLRDV